MVGDCTMRVETSAVKPFQYSTTILVAGMAESASPLGSHHLYGDGDLAVFLEDSGITVPMILRTLNELNACGRAEAPVSVPREVLEVLSRHSRNDS